MKKVALYPLLLAVYVPLALLANNLYQVNPRVVIRPLLGTILFSLLLFLILFLVLKRDHHKSAFITTLFLIFFFTYGHVYALLKRIQIGDANLGRHRLLIPIYLILLILSLVIALRRKDYAPATASLNLVAFALLLLPLYQLIPYYESRIFPSRQENILPDGISARFPDGKLPDIYYIVLDTHTSAYALQQDFGEYAIDITPFQKEMENLGFYVADCSRSNYGETGSSLITALNLYDQESLFAQINENPAIGKYNDLIQNSRVRHMLEQLGYTSIAFSTGYEWSTIRDADIYLEPTNNEVIEGIQPFEWMYLKTTALIILTDKLAPLLPKVASTLSSPHRVHIITQRFILNKLPSIASMDAPTFTFAHILIPHVHYVFAADGELLTDPGFFSGDKADAIDADYRLRGYTGQVQFIDSQILKITKTILEESDTPPIIIIQGDHGFRDENRYDILNMYFLPNGGNEKLYRTISPINSFRVVFDTYFGTNYGLLPDTTFPLEGTPLSPVREACK